MAILYVNTCSHCKISIKTNECLKKNFPLCLFVFFLTRSYILLFGHFSLILLGEMVINRNSSGRNQTFLSPLLFFFETTRRLCRRVVSEALPAIFPYNKKTYIKTCKQNIRIHLVNPS